jgi:gas vesicle protein
MEDEVITGSDDLGTGSEPPSLDDVLNSAFDDIQARDATSDETEKAERLRDESGRFAKTGETTPTPKVTPEPTITAPAIETPVAIEAPNTWTPAVKAKFATLDPEVQQEIMKREKEVARTLTAHDQDRLFGKSLRDVVSPYMPIINSEGSTPEQAIQSLLNTAYKLRTASPQEKAQLISRLAKDYGADMASIADTTQAEEIHPVVSQLQNQLRELQNQIQQREQKEQAFTQQNTLQQVETFLADPKYPHANDVANEIAKLIQSGMASTLQDAYSQAIYLHPEVRQKVISAQQTETNRKQIEEVKAKAESAKRTAAVNLRGKPSLPAKVAPGTIQQTLEDTFDRVMGVV